MIKRTVSAAEFGRVAVLMGGRSAEREISLISGNAVLAGLQRSGIDAYGIDVSFDICQKMNSGEFDRAFIVLHGRGGEDGEIQGFLQAINLPYTGSAISASVLSMNKRLSKLAWIQQGLPTALFVPVSAQTNTDELVADLGLPLIIKPVNEGSSIGMSKVNDHSDLQKAIDLALKYDTDVIAEQWIHGEEYTVAILDGEALPAIRLKTSHEFYDFDAKYHANDTEYLCPCGLEADVEKGMQDIAVKAFNALGMQGWGRIDFMRDKQGNLFLLEANSVPGMTDHSLVPMSAKQAGMSFDDLVCRILETSFKGEG
ncbi:MULTISPECIES: D-alanine--D-alanine ligase [unclassified Methylophaga]|jgi:D-alanine-D-alanine ligase|uniref:D-alanine--D-alanine ligase n=3 Tax=Methylophaga TaxID=40222 RepID=UPI00259CC489|nr:MULTISPECIES: D-alanine--D-alanine ligase [unclassified Methylophaga]|tara:strand:+ start:2669 stop:3607 length:939 start_codon:yes stop_codon:yes gene_type:complete